mmetsp:Transcript_29150/g.74941  ORF Transcript_29150/g.74941 Transcript_29150/m.74941 type:complete len:215 (-) Transcript_29150:2252-2896(-)
MVTDPFTSSMRTFPCTRSNCVFPFTSCTLIFPTACPIVTFPITFAHSKFPTISLRYLFPIDDDMVFNQRAERGSTKGTSDAGQANQTIPSLLLLMGLGCVVKKEKLTVRLFLISRFSPFLLAWTDRSTVQLVKRTNHVENEMGKKRKRNHPKFQFGRMGKGKGKGKRTKRWAGRSARFCFGSRLFFPLNPLMYICNKPIFKHFKKEQLAELGTR